MDLVSLISIAVTFFILAVTPGPATISNATIAMHHGRRIGTIYASGLTCGLGIWGLVAASGMGAVLQGSIYLLAGLKILGGLYLLWLAFQAARSAWRPGEESEVGVPKRNWFLQGLLLNLSNPKAVLAWMAALSVGLDSNDDMTMVIAATFLCVVAGWVCYLIYTLTFSFNGVMKTYQRCRRWIDGGLSGVFTIAGIGLIRSSFNKAS